MSLSVETYLQPLRVIAVHRQDQRKTYWPVLNPVETRAVGGYFHSARKERFLYLLYLCFHRAMANGFQLIHARVVVVSFFNDNILYFFRHLKL